MTLTNRHSLIPSLIETLTEFPCRRISRSRHAGHGGLQGNAEGVRAVPSIKMRSILLKEDQRLVVVADQSYQEIEGMTDAGLDRQVVDELLPVELVHNPPIYPDHWW